MEDVFKLVLPLPEKVREIIQDAGLTRAEVAEMLHVSSSRLNKWLSPIGSSGARRIPDGAFELLLIKIGKHPFYRTDKNCKDTMNIEDIETIAHSPETLREIVKEAGLTRAEAAELLHLSRNKFSRWLAPEYAEDHRPIPLAAFELLLIKLNKHPLYKKVEI
ncbi:hypothetical protein H0A36_27290 [Endozoicomonas sp. SM1973]|uniref:HTH cro/C1-type domain-containing protein n=1 Tax=Spartinivicinus marinus TaxID=2994442 RepID=A0A853II64_9GAMM|nr:transcriptional regulator [Spartinivicinus marinus]MCX4026432.1 hypothetical protein [Spartinivicinus marinus]NYZ69724.1 hypothetical protein [Spartinivicinus marinus]